MSVHLIYYQQGHKMMEAVATEEAYRRYRDSQTQARLMEAIRHPKPETDVSAAKRKLVQFNYSCLPTEDGGLKGAKRLSKSVGMDIDHLSADEVELVAATAIDKKDELGLLMLERSARRRLASRLPPPSRDGPGGQPALGLRPIRRGV